MAVKKNPLAVFACTYKRVYNFDKRELKKRERRSQERKNNVFGSGRGGNVRGVFVFFSGGGGGEGGRGREGE